LNLFFTYERKHVASVFLNVAYSISHIVLQLLPFTLKPHGVILPYGRIKLHRIYVQ
jgi:hypothetical protein